MTKEFNLSEKRKELLNKLLSEIKGLQKRIFVKRIFELIIEQDKEFIKRLKEPLIKEGIIRSDEQMIKLIDKLAGDKLT